MGLCNRSVEAFEQMVVGTWLHSKQEKSTSNVKKKNKSLNNILLALIRINHNYQSFFFIRVPKWGL